MFASAALCSSLGVLGLFASPEVVAQGVQKARKKAFGPTDQPGVQFLEKAGATFSYQMADGMIGGVAAADYDKDGDVDFFVPTTIGTPSLLIRNLGGGEFEEIAQSVGLASTRNDRAALWFDYNGDQYLDLVIARDNHDPDELGTLPVPPSTLNLFRQMPSGQFVDVTKSAGLFVDLLDSQINHFGALAAGDLNNDGWLDLVATQWEHLQPSTQGMAVMLNQQNGTFSMGFSVNNRSYWQPVIHDFNGDGWRDVYAAVDYKENVFALNAGGGVLLDVADIFGVDNDWNDMGATLGDYDNDQDLDLFITNIYLTASGRHNVLYEYDAGTGSFSEVAEQRGVENAGWGWGTTWMDADLDGWLDLAVTNGREINPNFIDDPSRFFWNQGGQFAEVGQAVGFDDTYLGSTVIALDYDRDGDLDLVQTCLDGPLRFLDNVPAPVVDQRHWLTVRPRMDGPNHYAIGAIVRVTAGDLTMMRLVSAGTSMAGQEPAEAFFGLDGAAVADTVTIEWPDGTVTQVTDVAADQVLTIEAP